MWAGPFIRSFCVSRGEFKSSSDPSATVLMYAVILRIMFTTLMAAFFRVRRVTERVLISG